MSGVPTGGEMARDGITGNGSASGATDGKAMHARSAMARDAATGETSAGEDTGSLNVATEAACRLVPGRSADLSGGFADPARDAARAFRSVLEAMARPGTEVSLTTAHGPAPLSPAAAAVLLTLVDRTTPLHLAGGYDCAAVRDWVAFHCGAPLVPAEDAAFALGDWAALQPVARFAVGTAEYPDRSATLIVEELAPGQPVTLSGPGIRGTAAAHLPDPAAFATNHARFPLGWDAILTRGETLIAIPRSTEIS